MGSGKNNEMTATEKRTGLILASIHTGSALNLWTGLASEADRSGGAFFIFPGGRLDSRPDAEYLRNSIYRLVNTENLDALISWGSSIGGAVPADELDNFHASFDPLPYVTIAHKMNGHPCVSFDAYTGMKELVRHFIRVHGARRIAFLRGPETHVSAEDRYRAFLDALAEEGLSPDGTAQLVSDPFPWSAGEAAVVQLYETRKLVPGKDFDTLIGASDMMVFSALRYLEKYGYRVPQDIRAGGFNDSAESRILSSPFSTVRMPYAELGLASFRMVRSLEMEDCVLPAEVLIRESCGCKKNRMEDAGTTVGTGMPTVTADSLVTVSDDLRRRKLKDDLARLFRLDDTGTNALLEPVLGALYAGDTVLFFNLFERVLERFFAADRDIGLLADAIDLVKNSPCVSPSLLAALAGPVPFAIARVQGRVFALKRYETGKRYAILNSLKCDLLCARSRASLVSILARHLGETGMHTGAIVLYESETLSRFIGGFSDGREIPAGTEQMPARRLLPVGMEAEFARGVFMVQPLFMENQPLGYFICSVPFHDGMVFEELRSAISSALKGIFLFEEMTAAKQEAEKAERAKTEFFANVGGDLLDPLSEIITDIDMIEKDAAQGIGIRLDAVKSRVATQLETTNRLVELTLSQIDELPFEKRLFRIGEILPGNPGHPLLYGDCARFARAFDLVREKYGEAVTVRDTAEGLQVSFIPPTPVSDAARPGPGLQLAEKIVVLQYGSFLRDSSRCVLTLPWPNLAGLPPARTAYSPSHILALGDNHSFGDIPLPVTVAAPGDEPPGTASPEEQVLLAWNADGAGIEEWLRVSALRHHPILFRSPFLCYGDTISGSSFLSVIESTVRKRKQGPVFMVGTGARLHSLGFSAGDTVALPSMDVFDSAVAEVCPSLVVFGDIDLQSIAAVRRNPATVLVPVLVLPERIESEDDITALSALPRIVLCNRGPADTPEFAARARAIAGGDEILPPHTGALVKKAILYLNRHASAQIARWKLADTVHVSDDYLTRIFHKETGLSIWEYLNRYRISLACDLLLHTNDSIYEIALRTGFQDQAYFCRVFKKIHGIPPGKLRSRQ